MRPLGTLPGGRRDRAGVALVGAQLQNDKAIIGIFDEGCMGMYNAIIDDELLNPLGIYKERLLAERAVGRDAEGRRRRGRRRSGSGCATPA